MKEEQQDHALIKQAVWRARSMSLKEQIIIRADKAVSISESRLIQSIDKDDLEKRSESKSTS